MTDATGTPADPGGKSRTWLIVVIVVVVLCCLAAVCVGAGIYAWNNGDAWLGISRLMATGAG